MSKIALEEHFVLDRAEHWERAVALAPYVPSSALEELRPRLTDIGEGRIEEMSKAGVDFAVLSNIGAVQGALDATPALRLAQEANDLLAEAVARHPDRLAGFATVPLQDARAGADELERSVGQLGLRGAMVFGHTNGRYLDDEAVLPFWERAEQLGVPVYLHAADASVLPTTYAGRPELMGATFSWTAETAAHALRLVFGGIFRRHPRLKVILGHLGEALPYLLWRVNAGASQFSKGIDVNETIQRNFSVTTASMFSDDALLCAIRALGEDAVMFSVDHPFASMEQAVSWFDHAPIDEAAGTKIAHSNASRLLGL